MAIRTYLTAGLTAGVTGAALAGVGTLLLADGDVSGPAQIEVQLVSNEEDILWLSLNGGSDRRSAAQSAVVQQSSANPALRPMIGDGGWLIAQDDVSALSNILRSLVADPAAFAEMGQLARRRFEREFTWAHYLARLRNALHDVGIELEARNV